MGGAFAANRCGGSASCPLLRRKPVEPRARHVATATMFLHLSCEPQIDRPSGEPLPLAARDAVLLDWLVIEGPTSRERLAAMLWPASGLSQARNTLRQRLLQLKKLVGMNVAIGSPTLALAPRRSARGGSRR